MRSKTVPLLLSILPIVAAADEPTSSALSTHADTIKQQVRLDQRNGASLPLDLTFVDDTGREIRLGSYFAGKPVLILPVWYSCPNLCGVTLRGLEAGLREIDFSVARDFEVVALSMDPNDSVEKAAGIKDGLVRAYGRPGTANGWHMLTGNAENVNELYQALGIGYAYDDRSGHYAHPATVVVATADGRISRYMPGVVFEGLALRLALLDAAQGRLGSLVDRILLTCYRYDPSTGRYSLLVVGVLRVAGGATALLIVGGVLLAVRRERRRKAGEASG